VKGERLGQYNVTYNQGSHTASLVASTLRRTIRSEKINRQIKPVTPGDSEPIGVIRSGTGLRRKQILLEHVGQVHAT
jgi:hypothetical protein